MGLESERSTFPGTKTPGKSQATSEGYRLPSRGVWALTAGWLSLEAPASAGLQHSLAYGPFTCKAAMESFSDPAAGLTPLFLTVHLHFQRHSGLHWVQPDDTDDSLP